MVLLLPFFASVWIGIAWVAFKAPVFVLAAIGAWVVWQWLVAQWARIPPAVIKRADHIAVAGLFAILAGLALGAGAQWLFLRLSNL